jgi:hypothetical protein
MDFWISNHLNRMNRLVICKARGSLLIKIMLKFLVVTKKMLKNSPDISTWLVVDIVLTDKYAEFNNFIALKL